MNLDEMKHLLIDMGEPRYRGEQVFIALQKGTPAEEITNISKELREKLKALPFGGVSIHEKFYSQKDDTIKYLFLLEDGNIIEGVLMRYIHGNTICISTQVGCRMGCEFCASTKDGLIRNLEPSEMVGQILTANKDIGAKEGERLITNVVLMGSGEPLDNYDNVIKFVELINHHKGFNMGKRSISISTCGLVPKIIELADSDIGVTLSISLHAVSDEARKKIMPIAKVYSLDELLKAAKYYADNTGRRVVFEYALVSGVNDSLQDAEKLFEITRDINCLINLIQLNPIEGGTLNRPSTSRADAFFAQLHKKGAQITRRRELGTDIGGACGQLKNSYLSNDTGGQK